MRIGAFLGRACAIELALCSIFLLMAGAPTLAQMMPRAVPLQRIEAPEQPREIPLYPKAKSSKSPEQWGVLFGQRIVRNVTQPTITPFLPDPTKATGAAVIVAPGGAFKMLSMDNEGWPVAQWLADRGIAAFVLKYRLNETPEEDGAFVRELMAVFAAAGASTGRARPIEEPRASEDALAALKLVRSNAARWGVDPKRVGMLGFSAGAMTTLQSVLKGEASDRSAFIGYIYGPMVGLTVPPDAPPMFAALAMDDPLFARQGFDIVSAWRAAGRPVELHVYEKGGHGYGMGKSGTTTTLMMDQFLAWMEARGLIKR